VTKSSSWFMCNRMLIPSLIETQILRSRFLVLFRSQRSEIMNNLIAPGLCNTSETCYMNAFLQTFYHIRPLSRLIVACPNRDPTVSKLRHLFVSMSQHQLTDAISLAAICKPDIRDAKDCSEFDIQLLGALHNSCSGILKSTIRHLICFQVTTQFSMDFSCRSLPSPPSLILHISVCDAPTLIECLDSAFSPIRFDHEPPETTQQFVCSFLRFLFINLDRSV
jgi:hypothetical protein